MQTLFYDMRFAIRRLRNSPGFTLVETIGTTLHDWIRTVITKVDRMLPHSSGALFQF